MKPEVTKEDIHQFLNGHLSMDRIIKIEGDYNDDKMTVIYRDENGKRKVLKDDFYPFLWCKQSAARQMCNGNRQQLKDIMARYCIACKGLRIADGEGNIHPRMENGYRVMFYSKTPMTYTNFLNFFKEVGRPVFPKKNDVNEGMRDYIVVSPVEQYMIKSGNRMFKGYEDYDDLLRLEWDLETEGLNPQEHAISQIGIRTNKGFEKIIRVVGQGEEKKQNELSAIKEFFKIIKDICPDIITGHNTENFDWNFIDVRLSLNNTSLLDETKPLFYNKGIYKKTKQQVLKLGGEMEYYFPTVMWGHNITDSLHAVRRAQAIDSNMKKADLKYVTKYSKLNKANRVYVPGKIINKTWEDETRSYAFNDENGHWFKVSTELLNKTYVDDNNNTNLTYTLDRVNKTLTDNRNNEKFTFVTGRYIVERYLLDDLWETDKVELRYNQPNFLVGKMLPVSFEKMCTMGTAAIWKYIMLAWSYEHGLGIPELIETKPFTGGLSRLLKVGYVDRVVKLDFNSLYPSIILTFNIKSPIDIMGTMSSLLEYILTQREHYKELKAEFGNKAKKIKQQIDSKNYTDEKELVELKKKQKEYEIEAAKNDKLQLPLKITGNGFFGSYGSGVVFPWSDLTCAEETTCTGRMMLRLMISHFTKLGYVPIVGDSFTADTPIFIKYNDSNLIDIKSIEELIDTDKINIDVLGREYDYSKKEYKVLCRSGWVEPSYIYRHKTNKIIYEVSENDMCVEVTEDHSLFNNKQEKIKPSEICDNTELEYFTKENIFTDFNTLTEEDVLEDNWLWLLNASREIKKSYLETINKNNFSKNKVMLAKIQFIENCIKYLN